MTRMHAVLGAVVALNLAAPAAGLAQTPAFPIADLFSAASVRPGNDAEQAGQAPAGNDGVRFVWREHPSLRFGRALRLDFQLKVQEDVINGLENTPKALIGLLAGENRGKRMVKV